MTDLVNIRIESNYSMNGSNIQIKELVNKAISYGYSSLALTDNRLYGLLKFYKECKKNNINPILGLEAYTEGINNTENNTVLLYAKNNNGYKNLLQLASLSALNGYLKISELKRYNKGVIIVVDTDNSELLFHYLNNKENEANQVYSSFTNLDNCYFNLSREERLNQTFEEMNRLVVLDPVKYLEKEDQEVFSVLRKIFNVKEDGLLGNSKSYHFKSKEELFELYKNHQKALERTYEITKNIKVEISFDNVYLPSYPNTKNASSKDYLRALVQKGLDKRLKNTKKNKKVYQERIDYELSVIDSMGYNDYFLIVWDFVKYSKNNDYLIGPGRGSAAASLVSYCLGITSVDSIEYDLVFERFLNPERISMPDIDMDLPDDKRDDIITYVRDFYGINKVASICTFGTFLSKSAIRDTARVLESHNLIIDEIVKETGKYTSIEEMIASSEKVKNIINRDSNAKELVLIASKIEGLMRHVSTHAAGIIVTSKELTNHTAVQHGLLNMMQTQFEAKDLEELGLLKIDFLGLRNLTSIHTITELINKNLNINFTAYNIPLDDQKTFDLLKRVETTGIFQLESQGIRSLIGQMQVDSFEDIVTILALFRPGPMENIPLYIKRRFGKEKVTYPHEVLEEILKPTNGIIIYQEQIIKIANIFAGYSLGEADVLRRAVSKKQESLLEAERANFIKKASNLGRDEQLSNEIYDYIVKFANYGFNRAHSVAYAMVSYWMAYLKANYPTYFISVLTDSVIGSETQLRNYIFEANKLGVRIIKPSVNHSNLTFVTKEENLVFPLLGIKNVGLSIAKQIVTERENGLYKSFIDFVMRNGKAVNKRALEYLVYSGAFDEFNETKRTMIHNYEDILNYETYGSFIDSDTFVMKKQEEYSYLELENLEKQSLGFNLTMNPINQHQAYIRKHNLTKPSEVKEADFGKQIRVVGLIGSMRLIKTKKNQEMAFLSIEDEYVKIDGVLFPSSFEKFQQDIEKGKVYLFLVKVEQRNNNIQFIINNMHRLDQ